MNRVKQKNAQQNKTHKSISTEKTRKPSKKEVKESGRGIVTGWLASWDNLQLIKLKDTR